MSTVDTCNALLAQALMVFGESGGINDQLAAMSFSHELPPIATFLRLSAPVDIYEKALSVRYPVATLYCERLKNTLTEKFRTFSGSALLVVELRVTGARADELDMALNSYVEAACNVLNAARGPWTSIGTYAGVFDVKFQAARVGGKQFVKSARIEFEIHVSK